MKSYTNVVVYDAAGDVPEWHALSHSLHTLCFSSRKFGLICLLANGLIRLWIRVYIAFDYILTTRMCDNEQITVCIVP